MMGAAVGTFCLLRAVLRLVELRGFEPLTFSLRGLGPAAGRRMRSARTVHQAHADHVPRLGANRGERLGHCCELIHFSSRAMLRS